MYSFTSFATASCLVLELLTGVNALVLPIRRSIIGARQLPTTNGTVQAPVANGTVSTSNNTAAMVNFGAGVAYLTTITINKQIFDVQLDTGSADLWVMSPKSVAGAFDSTENTTITYGTGPVNGRDKFGTVSLGGFTIENQLFMEVLPEDQPDAFLGLPGILGLGPNRNSDLFKAGASDARASTTLTNLFFQHNQTDSFFTMQLGRPREILSDTPGTITFGEVLPELSNITTQPKIPVVNVSAIPEFFSWTIVLDKMLVNGVDIFVPASVASGDPSQFVVLLDSGNSAASLPADMVDAIYGNIEGGSDGLFPCDSEVNVTFTFGGQDYPVHPLDILRPDDSLPENMCFPQFSAQDSDIQSDAVLGDAFLRSVYMLNHFGDTIRGGPTQPYIQLLSTVDAVEAHNQFVDVRVNGVGRGVVANDGPPLIRPDITDQLLSHGRF